MESQPSKVIVLDIENTLVKIEDIFKLYLPILPELIFVKHMRYPLEGKERFNLDAYFNRNLVRDTPWLSYLCIEYVLDAVKTMIYRESSESELFLRNPLLGHEGASFVNACDLNSIDQLIMCYVPNITYQHGELVYSLVRDIYNMIASYVFPTYENHLISFDATGFQVLLFVNENIKSYRFNEAVGKHTDTTTPDKRVMYTVTDIVTGEHLAYLSVLDIVKHYDASDKIIKSVIQNNGMLRGRYAIKMINIRN